MCCFINSNLDFLLLLATITGSSLLFFAALYFAAEAKRSQSKVYNAYLIGKAEALEGVLKVFQEKVSSPAPAQGPQTEGTEKTEPLDS